MNTYMDCTREWVSSCTHFTIIMSVLIISITIFLIYCFYKLKLEAKE